MRKLPTLFLLGSIFVAGSISATLYAPLSTSFEQQVDSANVIVKGKLRIAGQKTFFGYDENGQDVSLEERIRLHPDIPASVLAELGSTVVEYEIIVEEILKGEVVEPVILRQSILEVTSYLDETLSADRLFFLVRNHPEADSYGVFSFDSILEDIDGEYKFKGVNGGPGVAIVLRKPPYAVDSDMYTTVFEQLVRERVQ